MDLIYKSLDNRLTLEKLNLLYNSFSNICHFMLSHQGLDLIKEALEAFAIDTFFLYHLGVCQFF